MWTHTPAQLAQPHTGAVTSVFKRRIAGFRTHLWGHQGENLCKDNVTGQSKKDMIAERGEPHHPLEVCHVLRGGGETRY